MLTITNPYILIENYSLYNLKAKTYDIGYGENWII